MTRAENWLVSLQNRIRRIQTSTVTSVFKDLDHIAPNERVVGHLNDYLKRFWIVANEKMNTARAKVARANGTPLSLSWSEMGEIPVFLRDEVGSAQATMNLFAHLVSLEVDAEDEMFLVRRGGFLVVSVCAEDAIAYPGETLVQSATEQTN